MNCSGRSRPLRRGRVTTAHRSTNQRFSGRILTITNANRTSGFCVVVVARAWQNNPITDVRTDELSQLHIGDWVADSLLLDDLGYHDYGKIARIDEHGGWFVNRLKIDSNAPITEELERWPAGAISLEGTELQYVLPDLYRSVIDAGRDSTHQVQRVTSCLVSSASSDCVTTRRQMKRTHLMLIRTITCT